MDSKKQTKGTLGKINDYRLFVFQINQTERAHQLCILPIRHTVPLPKLQAAITGWGVMKFAKPVRQQISSFVMVFELINYTGQFALELAEKSIEF